MHYIGRDVFDHSNTLRPLVISRKNMQFYGNHEAAENTAIICSLLGSCKERGVNPREWLNDVISKLPYYLAPKSDRDLNCYRMYGENNQDSSGKMQEKTGKSETDTQ